MTPPQGALRLFVTGGTIISERSRGNLQALLDGPLAGQYQLEVVDVLEDPATADVARVVATPTLVRERPEPVRRLVGDLSDHAVMLATLLLPEHRFEVTDGLNP